MVGSGKSTTSTSYLCSAGGEWRLRATELR